MVVVVVVSGGSGRGQAGVGRGQSLLADIGGACQCWLSTDLGGLGRVVQCGSAVQSTGARQPQAVRLSA